MSLALIQSRALLGLQAAAVTVEVHLANGLPSFTLVGLADVEVKEARERVRSAILNAGLDFPHNKRIIVNLAPADLPKDSGRFDLPIALGILAASGQCDSTAMAGYEFAGELSLSGELRPVRGALAMSLALHEALSHLRLVLPMASAQEAALVPTAHVYGALHLLDVVQQFLPDNAAAPAPPCAGWARVQALASRAAPLYADLADVKGQAGAKRALEIAAAGGHSVLLMGSPGAGKSMLASRFAGILPPMSSQEALESAAIASLAGQFRLSQWGHRPTRSPHHTASAVALVGGGSPPRPGDISLAHHGVLFLDELPEFPRAALEALREPLESGLINISRAARSTEFPAQFQLIAAMNPCPCGYLGSKLKACRCSPEQVLRYQSKLSGPLMDRIDLHIEVTAMPPEELLRGEAQPGSVQQGQLPLLTPTSEASASIQARCTAARELGLRRQGKPNQTLQGKELLQRVNLAPDTLQFLTHAATRLGWTARATHRALRVARTIADMAGTEETLTAHVAEAIQYRRGLVAG